MAYRVVQSNKTFQVMEERKLDNLIETICIKNLSSREDAKQMMRKLNGGSGFNGWTPNFFLTEVKVK